MLKISLARRFFSIGFYVEAGIIDYPRADMGLSYTSLFLLTLSILVRSTLQQNCYFPNGVIARNDYPCTDLTNSVPGIQVHCCEVGRTCLPNRMCSGNQQDENPMRGTCTDSTWNSPNCPKFCTPCKLFRAPPVFFSFFFLVVRRMWLLMSRV